jgi:CRP-like cAMP-binding protein
MELLDGVKDVFELYTLNPVERDPNTNLYIGEYLWKKITYFSLIERSIMPKLAEVMIPKVYNEFEHIIKEGDEGDRMFILMKGKADVYIKDRYIASI